MKKVLLFFIVVSVLFFSCDSNSSSSGSSDKINDITTVTQLIKDFDATTPATTAVPSGTAYTANTTKRNFSTLDNDYQSAISAITSKIVINLSDETSWDSSVVRDGELVTITAADSVEIEIAGTTSKKNCFPPYECKIQAYSFDFQQCKIFFRKISLC